MSESLIPQNSLGTGEQAVLKALKGLRYGTVEVTVHDARIVEVTRKERQRLEGSTKTVTKSGPYQSPGE